VTDNNPAESKSTTSSTVVVVRPNTNVVALDYFGYNHGGALDTVGSNYWGHLSGTLGQMQVSPAPVGGYVTVDTLDNTENLQASLFGAPYSTNGPSTLFASFIVNMTPGNIPVGNGSYFMVYNDGTGVTGNYECGVYAVTNGAAPGNYRLGIENFPGNGDEPFAQVQIFPQDLVPGQDYVAVTELAVGSGFSTLWLAPTNGPAAPSVSDTNTAASVAATLFNISDLELRESGTDAGAPNISELKVGTTFDSVYPSPHIQAVGGNVVVNWSDPTIGLLASTNTVAGPYLPVAGALPPYTNNTANPAVFFMLGQ